MLRRIAGFCRRIFQSRGFRRSVRVLLWVLLAYLIYNYYIAIVHLMRMGMSFRQAVLFILETMLPFSEYSMPVGSVIVGTVIGLIWYFRRRRQNTQPDEDEDRAPAETGAPEQEEEIIETKHYTFR